MATIIGAILAIALSFWGLRIWAKSDLPIIMREIAINTRKEFQTGPGYNAVKILSILNKLGSVFLFLCAVVVFIASIKYGREYDQIFSNMMKK